MPTAPAAKGMAGLLQDAGVGKAAPAPVKVAAPAPAAPTKGMAALLASSKPAKASPVVPTPSNPSGFMAPLHGAADFVKNNFADVGKALTTPTQSKGFFQSLGEQFNSAVDQFDQNVDEWGQSGVLHKADALGKTMLLPVNLLFSPISAALQATQGVPVVGQIADGLNRLFGAIGAGGGDAANVALNALPISQESKDAIRPLTQQLGALAAQLATGKAGAKVLDIARGGAAEAPVEGAPIEAGAPKVVPEAARTEVVSTTKELGRQIVNAMQDPKSHEIMAERHEAMKAPVKEATGLFPKSVANPEIKGKINSGKAIDMHPDLRAEIRGAVKTAGPTGTHQALMDELGAGHRQAESLIREAPTPQTPQEELQAHSDALRSAVGDNGVSPDKMQVIPFGPKAKPTIDTIDADTGKVTKGVAPKEGKISANKPVSDKIPAKTAPKVEKEPVSAPEVKPEAKPNEPAPKPLETKPGESLVGKSIEAKAIEDKITKGFDKTAGYSVKPFKVAAEKTAEVINSGIDNARAIARGEKAMPEGMTSGSLIAGIEEYAKANPKEAPELLSELANSKVAGETSGHAQELGSLRMRTPDSATTHLQNLKKSLVEAAGGVKKVAKDKAAIIRNARTAMKSMNLTKEEASWDKFLDTITC